MIIFNLLFDSLLCPNNRFENCSKLPKIEWNMKWNIKSKCSSCVHKYIKLLALLFSIYPVCHNIMIKNRGLIPNLIIICARPIFVSFFIKFMCWMFLSSNDSYEMDKNMKFNERKRGHDVHDFNSCLDII